jgi:hypothetical protein
MIEAAAIAARIDALRMLSTTFVTRRKLETRLRVIV